MTLVPNHRQQSSGNSLLAILIALIFMSCNAFKVVSGDNREVVHSDSDSTDVEVIDVVIDDGPVIKDNENASYITVDFFGKEYQVEPHKTEFRVALILPFHFDAKSNREERISDYMVEYYQGVKQALTNLELYGLKLRLYVYDNENNLSKLKTILGTSSLKKMDVIVGPIGQEMIEEVSAYALKHDIAVISPITGIDSLPIKNGKLYSPTPNKNQKALRIAEYLKSEYKASPVVLITDGSTASMEDAKLYKQILSQEGVKEVRLEEKVSSWSTLLEKNKQTAVVVLSHKSSFVNSTLAQVYQADRDVMVFGEYSWSNFADNDYTFWNNLNVHLVASDYVNDTLDQVVNFKLNYRLVNKTDPGVYAYLGYDQFMFMGEFLLAFGEHFPEYINGREFRYLSSNFHYKLENGCNRNTNVFLLRFKDFELQPIE